MSENKTRKNATNNEIDQFYKAVDDFNEAASAFFRIPIFLAIRTYLLWGHRNHHYHKSSDSLFVCLMK
ncbi:hypothetical protein [Lysinibacillus sp. FN11]|uniref:hypothetical protein n=1 Tax=Lysinibacillus sp. FN11 TaxID=2968499 RepID=UPI00214C129A|nr:hypothetical protein [Lysinibacillus sp. FN11]UUV26886.1 hypothetical protein NP781_10030 [Lysinibacillus sp. FN11]